jgi:hypothetical protein
MSKQKMIYVSDELFELLKKEGNASMLICRLLNDYYKINKVRSVEELSHLREEIEFKQKHSIEELEKEKEIVVEQMQQIKTEIEIEEQAKIKALTKKQEFWNNCKSSLEEFSNNRVSDDIVNEYVERFNKEPDLNIIQFIAEKGL